MTLQKNAALVVLSGGQDSTTCLFWAKQHFDKLYAITFDYGQRHRNEIDIARKMAALAGAEFRLIKNEIIGTLGHNALVDTSDNVDTLHIENKLPNTFVPGRNLFFISMAAVWARELGVKNIITGVSQTDFSGYPDCRDSFIKSLNVTLNLAMDEQFEIITPLMWLDKAETWAMADQLGVFDLVRHESLTCYNGIKGDGCGECIACKLRRKGLETYLASKKQ
ncbi:MAG: 7-cyano-7-deazaguanine synthase QueC [Bacteroidales bacterium]|nr:7-cyano-7-deazaguanine synthase QueC [Bacteroidales bacterium]